jgi:hypothetical protein
MSNIIKHWAHQEEVMHKRGRETKNLNRVDIATFKDEYRNLKLTETYIRKRLR